MGGAASRHGWADGTILPSGARGWLPTNYCEPFSDASIENILSSLTYLWDLVQCVGRGDFTAFRGEDYVKRMIAGVRYFLVGFTLQVLVNGLRANNVSRSATNRLSK